MSLHYDRLGESTEVSELDTTAEQSAPYQFNVRILKDHAYFRSVAHAIVGEPRRFGPVIQRYCVDEGEWVNAGDPIAWCEENEVFSRYSYELVAPASGVIESLYGRESDEQKNEDVGSRQRHLPYGGIFVAIRCPERPALTDPQASELLLAKVTQRAKAGKAAHGRKALQATLLSLVFLTAACGVAIVSSTPGVRAMAVALVLTMGGSLAFAREQVQAAQAIPDV